MVDGSHEQPEAFFPQRLADDFGRLYPPGPPVPPRLDAEILGRARAHFARRRRVRLMLGWAGAASAAAAVIVLAVRLGQGPQITPTAHPQMTQIGSQAGTVSTVLAREDVDRNGWVDILDAFALARDVESGAVAGKGFDLDGDGRVGRSDVRAVAMAAVRLERGSLQ